MTLAVAFVRRLPERQNGRELVFASDSRLSNGQRFDQSQKVFDLSRSDCLFAFAGDTDYAYPLALQLIAAIKVYPRSIDRRFPIRNLRRHLIRVFDQVYRSIHHFPNSYSHPLDDDPPVQFLFAGYVWQESAFRIWYIDLDRVTRTFRYRSARRFFFIGSRDAVSEACLRTAMLLNSRGKSIDEIDMEPFEVLRDIICENKYPDIGGVPQIAKVYRHMNTQFFNVLWPEQGIVGRYIFGRRLLDFETSSWPDFDPVNLTFSPRGFGAVDETESSQL